MFTVLCSTSALFFLNNTVREFEIPAKIMCVCGTTRNYGTTSLDTDSITLLSFAATGIKGRDRFVIRRPEDWPKKETMVSNPDVFLFEFRPRSN